MIPELCVVKYQSVTKSDSDCIIKSRCKIRYSNGTSSSDETPDKIKEETTRLALKLRTKWSNIRLNEMSISRLRPIEQPKPTINSMNNHQQ